MKLKMKKFKSNLSKRTDSKPLVPLAKHNQSNISDPITTDNKPCTNDNNNGVHNLDYSTSTKADVQPTMQVTAPEAVDENTSSAFSSNDLDNFLSKNTHLNISYPIPSCTRTEAGVSRHDDLEPSESERDKVKPCTGSSNRLSFPSSTAANVARRSQHMESSSDTVNTNERDTKSAIKELKENISPKKLAHRPPVQDGRDTTGSDVFVYRAGKLVPLTSVIKKKDSLEKMRRDVKGSEVVYVYDNGKVLILGGSMCRLDPSRRANVTARLVMPMGLGGHAAQSKARTPRSSIQAVHIDEKLAKYALTALQKPSQFLKPGRPVGRKVQHSKKSWISSDTQATKTNILDILSAKLSLPKCSTSAPRDMKKGGLPGVNKKDESARNTTLLKRNLHRFPILSREMRRLDVNFVHIDSKNGLSSPSSCSTSSMSDCEEGEATPCTKDYCRLGCVCSSLQSCHREIGHCGRAACMFGCECHRHNWSSSGTPSIAGEACSILNISKNHQQGLALKEKDFRWTVVNTGSKVIMCGSERKRERKVPDRYRDSVYWKLIEEEHCKRLSLEEQAGQAEPLQGDPEAEVVPLEQGFPSYPRSGCMSPPHPRELEKAGIIPPSLSKKYVRPCKVSVPWYQLPASLSVWCLAHSCYDCPCCLPGSNISSDDDVQDEGRVVGRNGIVSGAHVNGTDARAMAHSGQERDRLKEEESTPLLTPQTSQKSASMQEESKLMVVNRDSHPVDSFEKADLSGGRAVLSQSPSLLKMKALLEPKSVVAAHSTATTQSEVVSQSPVNVSSDRTTSAHDSHSLKQSTSSIVTPSITDPVDKANIDVDIVGEIETPLSLNWTNTGDAIQYNVKVRNDQELADVRRKIEIDLEAKGLGPVPSLAELPREGVQPECVMLELKVDRTEGDCISGLHNVIKHWSHDLSSSARTCGYSQQSRTHRLVMNPHKQGFDYTPPLVDCNSNATIKTVLSTRLKRGYVRDFEYPSGEVKYGSELSNPVFCANRGLTTTPAALSGLLNTAMKRSVEEDSTKYSKKLKLDHPSCSHPNTLANDVSIGLNGPKDSDSDKSISELFSDSANISASLPAGTLPSDNNKYSPNKSAKILSPLGSPVIVPIAAAIPVSSPTRVPASSPTLIRTRSPDKVRSLSRSGSYNDAPSSRSGMKAECVSPKASPVVSGGSEPRSRASPLCSPTPLSPSIVEQQLGSQGGGMRRLSLPEMMQAEDRRGELELDLTDNVPGKALLVAESRFRKLINMSIIGVTGLNKQSRCMIAPVESSEVLARMRRIQTMISNRELDVGPNMREIFFPPHQQLAAINARPRFVMIRCDNRSYWEIAGLVQKKSSETKSSSCDYDSKLSDSTLLNSSTTDNSGSVGLSPLIISPVTDPLAIHEGPVVHDVITIPDTPQKPKLPRVLSPTRPLIPSVMKAFVPTVTSSASIVVSTSSVQKVLSPAVTSSASPVPSTSSVQKVLFPTVTSSSVQQVLLPTVTPSAPLICSAPTVQKIIVPAVATSSSASSSQLPPQPAGAVSKGAPVSSSVVQMVLNSASVAATETSVSTINSSIVHQLPGTNRTAGSSSTLDSVANINSHLNPVMSISTALSKPANTRIPSSSSSLLTPSVSSSLPIVSSVNTRYLIVPSSTASSKMLMLPPRSTNSGVMVLTSPATGKTSSGKESVKMMLVPSSQDPKKFVLVPSGSVSSTGVTRAVTAPFKLSTGTTKGVSTATSPAVVSKSLNYKPLLIKSLSYNPLAVKPLSLKHLNSKSLVGKPVAGSIIASTSNGIVAVAQTSIASDDIKDPKPSVISSKRLMTIPTIRSKTPTTVTSPVVSIVTSNPINIQSALSAIGSVSNNGGSYQTSDITRKSWAAIDLSLNFKSVKLGFLAGTIKKAVLNSIRLMSLSAEGAVSLQVRNTASEKVSVFGLARRQRPSDRVSLLILGSSIKAVESAYNYPTSHLFKGSGGLKYFIKESWGALSSYVYGSEDFLLKIASKKKNGEALSLFGMKYPIETFRSPAPVVKEVIDLEDSPLNNDPNDTQCDCTRSGDFMCYGHSTTSTAVTDKQSSAGTDTQSNSTSASAATDAATPQSSLTTNPNKSNHATDSVYSSQSAINSTITITTTTISKTQSHTQSVNAFTLSPLKEEQPEVISSDGITSQLKTSTKTKSISTLIDTPVHLTLSKEININANKSAPPSLSSALVENLVMDVKSPDYIDADDQSESTDGNFFHIPSKHNVSHFKDGTQSNVKSQNHTPERVAPHCGVTGDAAQVHLIIPTVSSTRTYLDISPAIKGTTEGKEQKKNINGTERATTSVECAPATDTILDSHKIQSQLEPLNITDNSLAACSRATSASSSTRSDELSSRLQDQSTTVGSVARSPDASVQQQQHLFADIHPPVMDNDNATRRPLQPPFTAELDLLASGNSSVSNEIASGMIGKEKEQLSMDDDDVEDVMEDVIVDVETNGSDVDQATLLKLLKTGLHDEDQTDRPPVNSKRKYFGTDRPCPASKKKRLYSPNSLLVGPSEEDPLLIPASSLWKTAPTFGRSKDAPHHSHLGIQQSCLGIITSDSSTFNVDKSRSENISMDFVETRSDEHSSAINICSQSTNLHYSQASLPEPVSCQAQHSPSSNLNQSSFGQPHSSTMPASSLPTPAALPHFEGDPANQFDPLEPPKKRVGSGKARCSRGKKRRTFLDSIISSTSEIGRDATQREEDRITASALISPQSPSHYVGGSSMYPSTPLPALSPILSATPMARDPELEECGTTQPSSQPSTLKPEASASYETTPIQVDLCSPNSNVSGGSFLSALLPPEQSTPKSGVADSDDLSSTLRTDASGSETSPPRSMHLNSRGMLEGGVPLGVILSKKKKKLMSKRKRTNSGSLARPPLNYQPPRPRTPSSTPTTNPPPVAPRTPQSRSTISLTGSDDETLSDSCSSTITNTPSSPAFSLHLNTSTTTTTVASSSSNRVAGNGPNKARGSSARQGGGGGGNRSSRGKDSTHNEMERMRRKEIGQLFVVLQEMLQQNGDCEPPADCKRGVWPKRMTLKKAIALLEAKRVTALKLEEQDKTLRQQVMERTAQLQHLLTGPGVSSEDRDAAKAVIGSVQLPTRATDLEQKLAWIMPSEKVRQDSADEEYVLDMDGSDSNCSESSISGPGLPSSGSFTSASVSAPPSPSAKFSPPRPVHISIASPVKPRSASDGAHDNGLGSFVGVTTPAKSIKHTKKSSSRSLLKPMKNSFKGFGKGAIIPVRSKQTALVTPRRRPSSGVRPQPTKFSPGQQIDRHSIGVETFYQSQGGSYSSDFSSNSTMSKRALMSRGSQVTHDRPMPSNFKSDSTYFRSVSRVSTGVNTCSSVSGGSADASTTTNHSSMDTSTQSPPHIQSPTLSFATLPAEFLPNSMSSNSTLVGSFASPRRSDPATDFMADTDRHDTASSSFFDRLQPRPGSSITFRAATSHQSSSLAHLTSSSSATASVVTKTSSGLDHSPTEGGGSATATDGIDHENKPGFLSLTTA